MRRAWPLALVGALVCSLSACGPSLDDYTITEVKVVEDLPKSERRLRNNGGYLRIDLASEFDLTADTNGNIYAYASRCPFDDDAEVLAIGPLAGSEPPVDLYDVGEAMPRDDAGLAHYVVYIPVADLYGSALGSQSTDKSADAVASEEDDLCLKIRQQGYYLTSSQSGTIRIPVNQWQAALADR